MRPGVIPVRGLFETHLTASDLDRSLAFYRHVVGLAAAFEAPPVTEAIILSPCGSVAFIVAFAVPKM